MSSTPQRLGALDGLRGFAAVIVVLWHALASSPLEAKLHQEPWDQDPGSTMWWLYDTPLRILTMGNQAVAVFFVLSGFVLTLPLLRGKRFDAWDYYPRRFLRLWLPTAAAAVLGVLLYAASRPSPDGAASGWVRKYARVDLEPGVILSQLFPLTGDTRLNNPAWSLSWELLYSFLLPLFVLVAVAFKARPWLAIAASTIVTAIGAQYGVGALEYLPLFLTGGLCAIIYLRTPTRGGWVAWAAAPAGLLLICVGDISRTFFGYGYKSDSTAFLFAGNNVGAALLVLGVLWSAPLGRLLSARLGDYLGRVSFSLYLVHVPIILATQHLLGTDHAYRALLISVPLSFAVADLFMRFVESPSTALAKRAGKWGSGLGDSLTQLNTSK